MKNKYTILILLLSLLIGCNYDQNELIYNIETKPELKNIPFVKDSLVLYELTNPYQKEKGDELIEFRGIDNYRCSFDSIDGLNIRMSFGFMSGETFSITIKDDSLSTNHRSWGCTSHESFRYETIQQKLTINTKNYNTADSIIGHINYVGIQDVEHKIKQWESYGEDSEWLKNLKPRIAKMNGYFKFKIFKSENENSNEYDRSVLYRKKQFNQDLNEIRISKSDSLNCSRMRIKNLPHEIYSLNQITKLNLEANNLSKLDFIKLTELPNLQKLYLGWNDFKDFPLNLTKNKNLIYVNLRGNPIESIPIEDLLNSNIKYINLKGSKLNRENVKILETKMKVEI